MIGGGEGGGNLPHPLGRGGVRGEGVHPPERVLEVGVGGVAVDAAVVGAAACRSLIYNSFLAL